MAKINYIVNSSIKVTDKKQNRKKTTKITNNYHIPSLNNFIQNLGTFGEWNHSRRTLLFLQHGRISRPSANFLRKVQRLATFDDRMFGVFLSKE
jgi:hypothetical protein